METIVKINVAKLKEDLKKLAENQRFLKNQRKTEKLVGERVMEPWKATYEHQANRENLRLMYAAYGLMRGKSFSQTENKYPEEGHPLNEFKKQIDEIILKYMTEEEEVSNLV
jgi:hypothetical protein